MRMNSNLKMLSDRKCIEYIFLIMCIAVLKTADTATRDSQSTDKVLSKTINAPADKNMIDVDTTKPNGPYIDKEFSKNVTALIGKTAYLNCRVKNLSNKTMLAQVSWIRHRDIHLLTVGRYTYTTDQRFRAMHDANSEEWVLQIKYPQKRDGGIYECQLSTTPHISHFIHLNVIEPSTKIIGAPDMYIESGSTINLTCIVYNSPEPPAFIYWYHNNGIINPNMSYENTKIINEMGPITKSFLLMQNAKATDSGHYQCNPSNSDSQNITVHVLNAKKQARTGFSTSAAAESKKSFIISIFNCALGIISITFCSTLCQINILD